MDSVRMKRLVFVLIGCGAIASVVFAAINRQELKLRANTYVGPLNMGGKTKEQAQKSVRVWWETYRLEKVSFKASNGVELGEYTPGTLGISVDDVATIAAIPTVDAMGQMFENKQQDRLDVPVVYKRTPVDFKFLRVAFDAKQGPISPAKVTYDEGAILVKHEVSGSTLNDVNLQDTIIASLSKDKTVIVPIKEADKTIPDEAVDSIREVVSTFTTRFSAGNRPRSSNIKLAASKLNGVVILPGEKLSFNDTVGRRTLKGGFQLAGVYVNGKHDTGVGGGICQVSTTLYNASLFANLKILRRSNHSLPVPYVPIGRDATVDYGSLDLAVQNTTDHPIAVTSHYVPGALTFRILGTKVPGLEVKVTQAGAKAWDRGTKTVVDKSLPANTRKVIEKGSRGLSTMTYRSVYMNGTLVSKETLGKSYYNGAVRVVAVGAGAPTKPPVAAAPKQVPNPAPEVGTPRA